MLRYSQELMGLYIYVREIDINNIMVLHIYSIISPSCKVSTVTKGLGELGATVDACTEIV